MWLWNLSGSRSTDLSWFCGEFKSTKGASVLSTQPWLDAVVVKAVIAGKLYCAIVNVKIFHAYCALGLFGNYLRGDFGLLQGIYEGLGGRSCLWSLSHK